ncbi:Uncharacterised protein [Brucella melitensis]|nr:Uncharacterised protein [Brucella melitensis]
MSFGPFDKVGNDQEIARKLHAGDDADLIFEAFGILFRRIAFRKARSLKTLLQALARLPRKFVSFRLNGSFRIVGLAGKPWQDRLTRLRVPTTTPGNFDRILKCFRQVGKKLRHFRAAFQTMIRCQAAAIIVGENLAFRNGEQRIMRLEILRFQEKSLVGRDQRQIHLVSQFHRTGFHSAVIPRLALQFDIETIAEGFLQESQARARAVGTIRREGPPDRPQRSAG